MRLLSAMVVATAVLSAPLCAAEVVATPDLPAPDSWQPRQSGVMHVLDKVSAQATTLTMHVGDTVSYQTLSITLSACEGRPPELPADSAARLVVVDHTTGAPGFSGWILSGEPGASTFENPVYDIQLAQCL